MRAINTFLTLTILVSCQMSTGSLMTRQTYDREPRLTKLATAHISKGGQVMSLKARIFHNNISVFVNNYTTTHATYIYNAMMCLPVSYILTWGRVHVIKYGFIMRNLPDIWRPLTWPTCNRLHMMMARYTAICNNRCDISHTSIWCREMTNILTACTIVTRIAMTVL